MDPLPLAKCWAASIERPGLLLVVVGNACEALVTFGNVWCFAKSAKLRPLQLVVITGLKWSMKHL